MSAPASCLTEAAAWRQGLPGVHSLLREGIFENSGDQGIENYRAKEKKSALRGETGIHRSL